MNEETEKLVKHCIEYATELLVETGESYPFGAFIDTIGNVHPLEMEIDKKNLPQNVAVIENLTKYCEGELKESKMNGYALAYEVELQLTEKDPTVDAIAFELIHSAVKNLPTFYLPFTKNKEGITEVQEVFAVK
jgi:hypothetical protein